MTKTRLDAHARLVALTTLLSTNGVGCFALADLDRFHVADAGNSSTSDAKTDSGAMSYQALNFHLTGMKPHVTQFFEYRIVDVNNFVQSRGIVEPWPGDEVSLVAPKAVPPVNGPYRLDFYMDMNLTRTYDGIGNVNTQDHAWRIEPLADYPAGEVSHVDGAISLDFVHNFSFTDIDRYQGSVNRPADAGSSVNILVNNLFPHAGKMLQVRVSDSASGHVVMLYRLTEIPTMDFTLRVPGAVEAGVDYNVDVYVDANGNGAYDNPSGTGGDLGWRLLRRGSNAIDGLKVTFDPANETNSSVDVGPP